MSENNKKSLNNPSIYFWRGQILNEAGRLVEKFSIGNFPSVAFEFAINSPFPYETPTIQKITGVQNLTAEEEEALKKIIKDCEDI